MGRAEREEATNLIQGDLSNQLYEIFSLEKDFIEYFQLDEEILKYRNLAFLKDQTTSTLAAFRSNGNLTIDAEVEESVGCQTSEKPDFVT